MFQDSQRRLSNVLINKLVWLSIHRDESDRAKHTYIFTPDDCSAVIDTHASACIALAKYEEPLFYYSDIPRLPIAHRSRSRGVCETYYVARSPNLRRLGLSANVFDRRTSTKLRILLDSLTFANGATPNTIFSIPRHATLIANPSTFTELRILRTLRSKGE